MRRCFRVVRVVALPRKYRGDARRPDLLHRGQDAQLVVDQHVVVGRVALLDVVQLLFLVDVDRARGRPPLRTDARALDLARLKDHVAVRQDHRRPQAAEMLEHVERARDRADRRTDSRPGTTTSTAGEYREGARRGSAAARRDNRRSRARCAAARRSPSTGRGCPAPNSRSRWRLRSSWMRSLSSSVLSTSSRKTIGLGVMTRASAISLVSGFRSVRKRFELVVKSRNQ